MRCRKSRWRIKALRARIWATSIGIYKRSKRHGREKSQAQWVACSMGTTHCAEKGNCCLVRRPSHFATHLKGCRVFPRFEKQNICDIRNISKNKSYGTLWSWRRVFCNNRPSGLIPDKFRGRVANVPVRFRHALSGIELQNHIECQSLM